MNRKIAVLLLGSVLVVSGAIVKGIENANANLPSTNINNSNISPIEKANNLDILAQYGGSPWGQKANSRTYTNPDTGQELCFYSSGRWAPCPGQGDVIIIPRGAKCRGNSNSVNDIHVVNKCPVAQCLLDKIDDNISSMLGGTQTTPPCGGLP